MKPLTSIKLIVLVCLLTTSIPTLSSAKIRQAHAQDTSAQEVDVSGPEIVGGEDAAPGEFPWQAMLVDKDGRFACGGVLIQAQWVLTAAHCLQHGTITQVILGAYNRVETAERNRQPLEVTKLISHEAYDPITLDNDIGLIQLSSPASRNAWVWPIPILLPKQEDALHAGTVAVVTGWGTLSEHGVLATALQKVAVPLVDYSTCQEAYDGEITKNMLCAGLVDGGKDSCQGDSGGPLIVPLSEKRGAYAVAGIVSWGNGCARPNYYGVYTKVPNYSQWLLEQIGPILLTPEIGATPPPTELVPAITDGDFETGAAGAWRTLSNQNVALLGQKLPVVPFSGNYAAQLGSANKEVSRLLQKVSFPLAKHLYLTFAYQIQSNERDCTHDRAKLFLDQVRAFTLPLCQSTTTTTWQEVAIELSSSGASSHTLQFFAYTDQTNSSSWYVDSVHLTTTLETRFVDKLYTMENSLDSEADETAPIPETGDETEGEPTEQATPEPTATVAPQRLYLPLIQR